MIRNFIVACGLIYSLNHSLHAMINQVLLKVDGLACPYCITGVDELVRSVSGVKNVEVWLQEGVVLVTWDIRTPFTPDGFVSKFKDAQFQLKSINIDVSGSIEKKDTRVYLHSTPDMTTFLIAPLFEEELLKQTNPVHIKGSVEKTDGELVLNNVSILP